MSTKIILLLATCFAGQKKTLLQNKLSISSGFSAKLISWKWSVSHFECKKWAKQKAKVQERDDDPNY